MKRSVMIAVSANMIMGLVPLYWRVLSRFSSVYLLGHRMFWSILFGVIMAAMCGKAHLLKDVWKNKRAMGLSVLSGLTITCNWAIYIWAVNAGMVADTSLAFYMSPLVVFVFGAVLFREKWTKWELLAVGFAVAGIVMATVMMGSFPWVALLIAFTFGLYGVLKKLAGLDSSISVAVEMTLLVPVSLGYLLVTSFGPSGSLVGVQWWEVLLLVGTGLVTAFPLQLYNKGVNDLPLSMVGFIQYVWPTTSLVVSIFILKEDVPPAKMACFALIWVGLLIFSLSRLPKRGKTLGKTSSKA